jgi:hypothetical protein
MVGLAALESDLRSLLQEEDETLFPRGRATAAALHERRAQWSGV